MQLLLLVLLFSVLQIHLATRLVQGRNAQDDCKDTSYVSSYNKMIEKGIQVLDALTAQSELNENHIIHHVCES